MDSLVRGHSAGCIALTGDTVREGIRGVVFDMDGLLLDTERLCLEAFNRTASAFGLPDMEALFLSFVGMSARDGTPILAAGLGDGIDVAAFSAHWDGQISAGRTAPLPVKADVRAVLERLQDAGLPMAVATATRTAAAKGHLEDAGLLEFFASVTGGDQVANSKPDPEIYHRACATLGLPPEACVAFEDSDPGVRAAVAAGLRTVQVPDLKQPSDALLQLSHIVAPSLWEGAVRVGLIEGAQI